MHKTLQWLAIAEPTQVADVLPPEYLGRDKALYLQAYAKFREAIAPPQLMSESAARNGLAAAAKLNSELKTAANDVGATIENRFMQKAMIGR